MTAVLAAAAMAFQSARLIGVDPSPTLLAKARGRPELMRATLLEGGVESIPLGAATADFTLSLLVLQEFSDRPAALSEMRRIARPGGTVAACQGDGTIDSEERAIVTAVGDWMERFGAAIHGTRPWHIFGEGPTQVVSGMFGESAAKPFTPQDIRFTTKSGDLFATTLGAPGDVVTIASLSSSGQFADGRIERVGVVGNTAPLNFTRDAAGLHIQVPGRAVHEFGVALRIVGNGLVDIH